MRRGSSADYEDFQFYVAIITNKYNEYIFTVARSSLSLSLSLLQLRSLSFDHLADAINTSSAHFS